VAHRFVGNRHGTARDKPDKTLVEAQKYCPGIHPTQGEPGTTIAVSACPKCENSCVLLTTQSRGIDVAVCTMAGTAVGSGTAP